MSVPPSGNAPPSPGAAPGGDPFPFWRRNMFVMAAATFSHTLGFGIVNPFFPLILKEMGATGRLETWVGYSLGSYFTLSFFLTPLWGVVADHYGRKLMALRTSLGMATIFLLLPMMPSLGWFLALFFLMGTTNGFIPATSGLIATNTPRRSMGRSLSFVQTGTLIGGAVGPAVGALIASLLPGYRYLYWVSAASLVTGGVLTMLFARERHQRPAAPFRIHLLADLKVILRIPNILTLMLITFTYTFVFLGAGAIISVFTLDLLASEGIHSGPQVDYWVGAVTLALALASALAVPFWGRLLDRFGPGRILAVSLLAGALASIPTILVQSPLQMAMARFLLGLLAIGIGPAATTMTKNYAPRGMESRVLAYSAAFGALGIGGGPFIAGIIGPVVGLRVFFALNSLLLLAAFLLWLRALTRGAAGDPGAESGPDLSPDLGPDKSTEA